MDSGEHDGEAEVCARKALTTTARLERLDKYIPAISSSKSDCSPLNASRESPLVSVDTLRDDAGLRT